MMKQQSLARETAAGRNNQVREGAARILFLAAACVSILAVLLITVFLLVSGVPAIAEIGVFKFLFGTVWKPGNDIYGILPMILGSFCVTAGALVLGVPIGVLTAIFLSRFASKRMVKLAVEKFFGVKVKDVRTMNYKGKAKRFGRSMGKRSDWKKAIVVLADGEKLVFV